MKMKTIKDIDVKNKKVLVRVGFDVPISKDGIVDEKEAWRIRKGLPTIKYLLRKNCKIILATHLDRPDGKIVEALRLGPIQDKLSELLNLSVARMPDCIGGAVRKAASKMQEGEILLLENLRFYPQEKKNDLRFAKKLARLADIYINDAFSVCHRHHASVVGITKYLPSVAGLLLSKEIKILSRVIKNSQKPAVVIIGGVKVETKLPMIKLLAKKFDWVLVGGVVANKFRVQSSKLKVQNIRLPVDYIFDKKDKNSTRDIGPKTITDFCRIISKAEVIIWNGPMGKFEDKRFTKGTKEIAKTVVKTKAYKIIGGGDTVLALSQFNLINKMDFVSTGGGAMLEFLAGKKLPGITALMK